MRLAELVSDPARFFGGDPYCATQQGDLVLAPIVRLQADAGRSAKWNDFDEAQVDIPTPDDAGELLDVVAHSGYGPAMIVSHDCQLDRELSIEAGRLRREDRHLSKAAARAQAELDPELDRFLQVVPLLEVDRVRPDWASIENGTVIGLFPIPAVGSTALPRPMVADLCHRSTIDRSLLRGRYKTLSDEARTMLRYALMRLDALRSPDIGFELESIVGRRVVGVSPGQTSPLHVQIELDDDTVIELLHEPPEVTADESSRTENPGQL